jgi:hypothetical protein
MTNPIEMISTLLFSVSAMYLLASLVFGYLGLTFKDKMFRFYGLGTVMIAVANLMSAHTVATHTGLNLFDAPDLEVFVTLMAYGLSGVFLFVGAMNGSRNRKETPYIMTGAVLVSAVIGAYFTNTIDSAMLPSVIGAAVGYLFAAYVLFLKCKKEPLYMLYSLLFFFQATFVVATPFVYSIAAASTLLVMGLLLSKAAVAATELVAGVALVIKRHRTKVDCVHEW